MRPVRIRTGLAITGVLISGVLVLASCSTTPKESTKPSGQGTTTSSSSATTTTASSAPSTTVAPTTTTSTTTPVPTTTSTLPSNYCQVSDLHASVEGTEGAAGTIEVTFRLTNVSPSTCVFWAYPGALLLSHSGAPLPTDVIPGGSLSFLNIPVTTTTVVAGGSAFFNLGYSDVVSGGESSCPTATSLEITPPNDTQQLVVQVTIDACDGGRLSVSPVFGASSPATSTTAPPG